MLCGHGNQSCRASDPVWGRCASVGHNDESCTSMVVCCFHCKGAHSTSLRDCPKWKKEKEDYVVKAMQGISYFDERKKVRELHAVPTPSQSYASAVMLRPAVCTVEIQTDLSNTLETH